MGILNTNCRKTKSLRKILWICHLAIDLKKMSKKFLTNIRIIFQGFRFWYTDNSQRPTYDHVANNYRNLKQLTELPFDRYVNAYGLDLSFFQSFLWNCLHFLVSTWANMTVRYLKTDNSRAKLKAQGEWRVGFSEYGVNEKMASGICGMIDSAGSQYVTGSWCPWKVVWIIWALKLIAAPQTV